MPLEGDSNKTHLAHRKLKSNLSKQESKEVGEHTDEEGKLGDKQIIAFLDNNSHQKRQMAGSQLQRQNSKHQNSKGRTSETYVTQAQQSLEIFNQKSVLVNRLLSQAGGREAMNKKTTKFQVATEAGKRAIMKQQ